MVSRKLRRRLWWGFKWELLPHRNVYRPLGGPRRWKEKERDDHGEATTVQGTGSAELKL